MMMANRYRPQSNPKRLPRYKFESSDRTLLQNLVNKYIGILERKAVNQNMLDEKKRAWQIITQKFNSQSADKRVRDAKQLRKCWENMKWRARRELKQATMDDDVPGEHELSDFTHPSHLTTGLIGVEEFMNGEYDDENDDEQIDDDEGEDDDEEEEEAVAPMGTEPIQIGDESSPPGANGTNAPLIAPPDDPRLPGRHPISQPPDDELIGSFVADAWIAEDGPGDDEDREAIHIKTEVQEVGQSADESQIWNGTSSSPVRSLGGGSSNLNTRTPPPSDVFQDPLPRAPSVSSSAGDAVESLSSRHSISSMPRSRKRPREVNHNHIQNRPSPAASMVLVDGDARCGVDEAGGQLLADEEHAKKIELLQAQLDYEKSKVERMRRMMEMSEIEHRARMRMLVRYQQVAEKQKEYWSEHVDNAKQQHGFTPTDQF